MGANVFLARCDADGYERTIESTVDPSEYDDGPAALDGDAVRLWGVPEGKRNRNYFEAMESGDLVLFYLDDEYVASARVGTTFEDEEEWASEEFWSTAAPLVYTLEDFTEISVPGPAAHGIFEYAADYTPDALSRVADGRVDNSLDGIELALQRFSERNA